MWGAPIGTHQGISHPLAEAKIELELARLMTQKAAALYDAGAKGAGEASNMAKYAAAEAADPAASTRRSRPTAATASRSSTGWPSCGGECGVRARRRSPAR